MAGADVLACSDAVPAVLCSAVPRFFSSPKSQASNTRVVLRGNHESMCPCAHAPMHAYSQMALSRMQPCGYVHLHSPTYPRSQHSLACCRKLYSTKAEDALLGPRPQYPSNSGGGNNGGGGNPFEGNKGMCHLNDTGTRPLLSPTGSVVLRRVTPERTWRQRRVSTHPSDTGIPQ